MSQKRKVEEYHDPDYPNNSALIKQNVHCLSPKERLSKIQEVIKREFQKELTAKEQEVLEIDARISATRKLLHRVRYAVVSNYYNSKSSTIQNDTNNEVSDNTLGNAPNVVPQEPIHPALKSIIGKRPINYNDFLKDRPTREAFKAAKTTIAEKLRVKQKEKKVFKLESTTFKDESTDISVKVPRYIDPVKVQQKIPQINSARGRNQTKHLIVVGNTSKFIGNDSENNEITHKWLVYVKTKTPIPVEQLLNKVRFFLHPSYKPNDIVDVCTPPFQLSRRGWGEFPVRVQLFFNSELQQKPIQLVHNLVLDKTLSGLQTIGAETLVEIWLSSDHLELPKAEGHEKKVENISILPNIGSTQANNRPPHHLIKTEPSEISYKNEEPEEVHDFGVFKEENSDHAVSKYDVPDTEPISERKVKSEILDNFSMSEENVTKPSDQHSSSVCSTQLEVTSDVKTRMSESLGLNKNSNPSHQNTTNMSLKKSVFKCIGKDGQVKYVEMYVSPSKSINGTLNENDTISHQLKSLVALKNKDHRQPTKRIVFVNRKTISDKNENNSVTKINASKVHDVNCNNAIAGEHSTLNQKSETPQVTANGFGRSTEKGQHTNISQSSNQNQVIFKNGKMYIKDPIQTKLKRQMKRQQSLLKPQISLLKPIVKNDNANCMQNERSNNFINHNSVAIDHDYTSWMGKSPSFPSTRNHAPHSIVSSVKNSNKLPIQKSIVTVSGPHNTPINVILTSTKTASESIESKKLQLPIANQRSTVLMKRARYDYRKELEDMFHKRKFCNVRHAVDYLLRNLPLTNFLSTLFDYKTSFPFAVADEKSLCELTLPKRKSNEWIRAKFIASVVKNHFSLNDCEKWTTKEIILYARHHAYTPIAQYLKLDSSGDETINHTKTLKDLVKNEIKKESYLNQTVTLNHSVYKWINEMKSVVKNVSSVEDIINVDQLDVDDKRLNKLRDIDPQSINTKHKYLEPVDENLQNEIYFINECTQQLGIKFFPEEIEPGILHSSSQVVLACCLQNFIEDIVRRSASVQIENEATSLSKQIILKPESIKKAVTSRKQFDFLTNKYLGVAHLKHQLD